MHIRFTNLKPRFIIRRNLPCDVTADCPAWRCLLLKGHSICQLILKRGSVMLIGNRFRDPLKSTCFRNHFTTDAPSVSGLPWQTARSCRMLCDAVCCGAPRCLASCKRVLTYAVWRRIVYCVIFHAPPRGAVRWRAAPQCNATQRIRCERLDRTFRTLNSFPLVFSLRLVNYDDGHQLIFHLKAKMTSTPMFTSREHHYCVPTLNVKMH